MIRKIINLILILGLLFQQTGFSYAAGELNIANYLSQARSAIVTPDQFRPPQLRFISYDTKSNDFKLFLDSPAPELLNSQNPLNSPTPKLNDSTQELFNYFLTGLALPNDTFWVNLRPDAPDNIIDPLLEKTEIGKIFLEADLQLKKDTASYTSPQNPQGRQYWDKLYKKAGELFGSENITIPTITRPWIVPNEVIVRETEDSAYIYKATLKVMLEEDYLKNYQQSNPNHQPLTSNYSFSGPRMKELNQYSTQLIKETIIPQLTKEVNSSKRYAKLRQVYYSLVLSRWFKQKYSRGSAVSGPQSAGQDTSYVKLINSRDLTNLASHEPCDKQAYFQAYQKSFKDGEYNLQETLPTPIGQSIRSYVSGGIVASPITFAGINAEENIGVTKALTGQPPATTASPLDIDEIVKNIGDMFTGRGLRTANLLGVKYPEKLSEEIKVLIKDYYANPDDAVKFSKASKALREVVKVEGYDQESKEIIEKGITWSIIATGELVNYYQKSIPLGLELISKLEGTLDKKIIFTTQKGREAYKDEFGNAQRELKKYVAVEKAGGFLEEIMDRGEDIYILKYKFMEAEAKFSAGSPLNGEALEVELVKLPKTEKLLSDLIKIFSKVDKSAQLGPQIAILIAEMLTESGVTPFPGESPNVYLMRGAVMKSVTTFFSSKKLYNLYSKDRFSITEVLDKIKEGLLLEKSTNIPGRKISEETKKYIIALIDLYIEAVDNAKNAIEKQGETSVASPLTLEKMKSIVFEQAGILKDQYSSSNNERNEIENMVANVPNMRTKKELKEFVLTEMISGINSYIKKRNSESEEELRSRNFEAYKEIYRKVMLLISVKEALVLLTKGYANHSGAASPAKGVSSSLQTKRGGIDFTDRALQIKLERVGSFADLKMMLPGISNVEAIDLDNEFKQIQAMVSSSIRPSDTRILEFAAACYYRGEFDYRLTQVSSCIKAAHLADELLGRESSQALRLATILPDAPYGGRI